MRKMSRRDFVKGATSAGALAGTMAALERLDELEEFLFDSVLEPEHEARQGAYLLLVENAPEFGHRVHEPHSLIDHPANVPRPDSELARYLVLGPLTGPVVEQRRRLDLGHHELIVFHREREGLRRDLVLDPHVVAPAKVQLRHVRGRAHRPHEVER